MLVSFYFLNLNEPSLNYVLAGYYTHTFLRSIWSTQSTLREKLRWLDWSKDRAEEIKVKRFHYY